MTEQELPAGWTWTTLGEVAEVVRGVTYRKSESSETAKEGMVPLVRATNIRDSLDTESGLIYVPSSCVSAMQMLRKNDIVLAASSGSISVVGKSARLVADWDGTFGAFCAVLRPCTGISPKYLALLVKSDEVRSRWSAVARGTNINNLKRGDLIETPVPLPPLLEQHRIVEALEDHLSRLDTAELTLSQVKTRAANLSGKAINFSYGITMSAAGSALPPTPTDVVDGDLPSLPASWSWRRLGELGEVVGGITKDAKKQSDESYPLHPYLRVANVQAGHLDLDRITEIRATPKQVEKLTLRDGDVLLNEGGDRDKLGRGWIWENQIPNCLHQNHVFRIRVDPEEIDPRLIAWHANSFGRSWFIRNGKQSVNLASVSLKTIKAFPVPMPPPEEQESIVESITTALESQSRLQSAIDVAMARSTVLRRSLFRAAFNGVLVDQDPTDEPADVTLAKIREQQSGIAPRRRGRGKTVVAK